MNVPRSIFREYDVRGIVGKELTPGAGPRASAAASPASRGSGSAARRCIAVGRDNRPSGAALADGRPDGASSRRAAPRWTSGCCPPRRSTSRSHALETDGGLQVTGSHNPPEFNGFKMVLGGEALPRRRDPRPLGDHHRGAVAHRRRTRDATTARAAAAIGSHPRAAPARPAGEGRGRLRQRRRQPDRRADHSQGWAPKSPPLFCESDGTFPNHHPDPTVPENLRDLQAAVRRDRRRAGHRVRRRRRPDRGGG